MKRIFADTSALIAIGNKDDEFHQEAVLLQKGFLKTKLPIVTTSGVILELFNTFSQARCKPIALRLFKFDPLFRAMGVPSYRQVHAWRHGTV
jgi:predicted nucleic acid-binding protein